MASAPLNPPSLEQFARLLATGVEASEAYRTSGVGGALACTVREAERRPDVQARVAVLRSAPKDEVDEPKLDPRRIGKLDVIAMLLKERELARATGQAAPAVRATELIGKELGMFVDRKIVDLTVLDKMDIEEQKALLAAIEELDGKSGGGPKVVN